MSHTPDRLASLDQFRGYTVLGMFLVNFAGGYKEVPRLLRHEHTFCSYADTIMPQFLLAVGFALRLTFLRRRAADGAAAAYAKAAKRCLGLVLLGCVVYHLTGRYDTWDQLTGQPAGEFLLKTFKRGPFETLTHIGVTALWVLPVLAAPGWVRVSFAAASGGLHVWASFAGYYQWNLSPPAGIDGGPLGFLTWTIPLVAGTLAHDWVLAGRRDVPKLLAAGGLLMLAGYGLSLLNPHAGVPFVPPADPAAANAAKSYWTMSQRAGSVTYLLFAAGFGLAVYALFRVLCDGGGVRWGYLDLLGRNALAGYLIHSVVAEAVKPFVPKDAPLWYVAAGFGAYLGVTTLFLRHLDRNRLYLRL